MISDESVPHFYVKMPDGSFKQTHLENLEVGDIIKKINPNSELKYYQEFKVVNIDIGLSLVKFMELIKE